MQNGLILPNYELIKKEGPDHNPFFIIKVTAMGFFFEGKGKTIKLAELDAAKNILKIIREKNINNKEISYSGLVSLVGAPNAGKSTLINTIIGEKIAIVGHKSQTTRTSIKGIFLKQNTQIVFIDTPGIFKSKRFLDELMVNNAWKSLNDSDLVCLLYDVGIKNINSNTLKLLKILRILIGQ